MGHPFQPRMSVGAALLSLSRHPANVLVSLGYTSVRTDGVQMLVYVSLRQQESAGADNDSLHPVQGIQLMPEAFQVVLAIP